MMVLVLGMHRSGTSALAGLLHNNGVVMGRDGEFYPPPMKENPKGFFENRRFRTVNDMILRQYGYRVKSFSTQIPTVYAPQGFGRGEMEALIKEYNDEFEFWGWKDPRTCLTLFAWLDIIHGMGLIYDLKILHIFRNYEEVSRSMKARGNKEKYGSQFYQLAAEYHSKAMTYMAAFEDKLNIITLRFLDLIQNTEDTVEKINEFLGADLISDTSFVDSAISKNSSGGRLGGENEQSRTGLRANTGTGGL